MNIRSKSIGCLIAVAVMLFTSVPVSAAGSVTDIVGIDINGEYSDWDGKPYTQIQKFPGENYYLGTLFRDAVNVYLHIRVVSPNGILQFNGWGYEFTVDGTSTIVAAVVTSGQIADGNNVLEIQEIRGQNGYRKPISGAEGFLAHLTGEPDEWELSIPLEYFSNSPELISTITFNCWFLGPQVLTATGTPTWPYLVAGTGVAIAFAGYMLSKRKHAK